jgi:hypothetical protein
MAKLKSMFRWWPGIQRAGVAVCLLVSFCAGTLALPHAEGAGDAVCRPIVVNHDESAHYVGEAPPLGAEGQHCFLCHSLRVSYRVFDKYEQRNTNHSVERLHGSHLVFAGRLEWSIAPGRAPPA